MGSEAVARGVSVNFPLSSNPLPAGGERKRDVGTYGYSWPYASVQAPTEVLEAKRLTLCCCIYPHATDITSLRMLVNGKHLARAGLPCRATKDRG